LCWQTVEQQFIPALAIASAVTANVKKPKSRPNMKLFTINSDGKLTPYKEQLFREENRESDLEKLLEENPEYFFEDSKVLVIGRQVPTNLGTWIDLLGLDKYGNTVLIELKRGKSPRETVAQLLEYASFIENLDYESLNVIYQSYIGEETSLDNYHQEYFAIDLAEKVSFNKATKLVIVAQEISTAIKQTSLYLRKKGFDIYCMEFKYFHNYASERMITSDFVVGEESFLKTEITPSVSLPKIDEKKFLASLESNGRVVCERLFQFAKNNNLFLRWGSKGFSLNLRMENGFVALFFGYPPTSVFKQSIYSGFEEITKKVNNAEEIIEYLRQELEQTGFFESARSNLKWIIRKPENQTEIDRLLSIITKLTEKIRQNGLKG
jgi:hypothetical protein